MKKRPSRWAVAFMLLLSGAMAYAQDACERLTAAKIPNTTITLAQTVAAGTFNGPPTPRSAESGLALLYKSLPAFCRVVAEAKPTSDSDIKLEVWLPVSGWNGKLEGIGAGGFAGSVLPISRPSTTANAATDAAPAYAADGDMLPPANYREWIYLSTGIDMSYSPKAGMQDHSVFDNVFVNPAAYRSFLATGTWPDKTVMVLEARGAQTKGSINQRGRFQNTEITGLEVHVKDEARFPGKWAFFDLDSLEKNGTLIPQGAPCYTCHAAHGAVDTTFVQFYPTLMPIAKTKGTLSAAFQKEEATQIAK